MAKTARRIPLPFLVVPFAASAVAGYVADATWPTLVTEHPLVLIMLSARNRYMLLARPNLDATTFFVAGFLRLILTDPVAFLLGRQYGEAALGWVEKKTKRTDGGSMVRQMEQWFGKASALFIIVAPSFIWCVMAGASRMRVWVFVTCNVVGTIGRLWLIWVAGDVFSEPIDDVLGAVKEYQVPLLMVSAVIVLVQVVRSRSRGELETPGEIEADIEAELAAEDQPEGA